MLQSVLEANIYVLNDRMGRFILCDFYFKCEKPFDDDPEQTLAVTLQHLDEEHRTNIELTEIRNDLSQKYVKI